MKTCVAIRHVAFEDLDLPHGADHLASTPLPPNQAFARGQRALAVLGRWIDQVCA